MVVLGNRDLDPSDRAGVIERLDGSMIRRPDVIEMLLGVAGDRGDAPAVRAAALTALGAAAFQVRLFAPFEVAYEGLLRDLVDDGDDGLREAAVAALAVRHDGEIQRRLQAGLRGDAELPVARERAIQLLAEDDHLDNLPWLVELYDQGGPAARSEAARMMGSYPAARERLEAILRDRGEDGDVRQQSAASLRALAPERFEAAAKEIVMDGGDDPDVRVACLHTLQHLGDAERVFGDQAFVERVAALGDDDSAPELARVARGMIEQRDSRGFGPPRP
jgi:hypothetical protein